MGKGWHIAGGLLPKNGQRVDVKIGGKIKRIIYTAGMKGDDLSFSEWREAGYEEWYNKLNLF